MEIGTEAAVQSWLRQGSYNTYKKSSEVAVYNSRPLEEEAQTSGRVLGLSSISYGKTILCGVVAVYDESSTKEDPVIRVTTNYGSRKECYEIHVNEVEPRSATQIEMFALTCYTDDVGLTDGGSFGSFMKMKAYAKNAAYLKKFPDLQDPANADVKLNWIGMLEDMAEVYRGNVATYGQAVQADGLAASFWDWSIDHKSFLVPFERSSILNRSAETTGRVPKSFEEIYEKAFLKKTTEEANEAESEDGSKKEEKPDYHKMIQDKIDEIYEKLKNGETEEEFMIGGASFTIREWEMLLEKFDSAEEAIKAAMEERIQKQKEKEEELSDMRREMLFADTVQARFWTQRVDKEGNRIEDIYLTAIDRKGIRCCKSDGSGYEWEIEFTDESQYRMATGFLDWAREHMDNFLFASHKNFWEDFLDGSLDTESFKEFLEGTNNGVPNYGIGDETNMRIDYEKVQWAPYMNPHGGTLQVNFNRPARQVR